MARREFLPGELVTYKVIPSNVEAFYIKYGMEGSSADWSALYCQFTVSHALSYTANHFDRGNQELVICQLVNRQSLTAFICDDKDIAVSEKSSIEKAVRVRTMLNFVPWKENEPLLKDIGEQLPGCFLITYDTEENWECVIPHSAITEANFSVLPLIRFAQNPLRPWAVTAVTLLVDLDHTEAKVETENSQEGAVAERLPRTLSLPREVTEDVKLFGEHLESSWLSSLPVMEMLVGPHLK